jgi:hypothetical protein
MAEKQHWIGSPAVVAAIAAASTLAVAIVGQYSFADKTICGIRENEMRDLLAAYQDELSGDVEWMAKFQAETIELLNKISEQLYEQQTVFKSQLTELERRYNNNAEKLGPKDFVFAIPAMGFPGKKEIPAIPSKTEFQRKLGALYARCLR